MPQPEYKFAPYPNLEKHPARNWRAARLCKWHRIGAAVLRRCNRINKAPICRPGLPNNGSSRASPPRCRSDVRSGPVGRRSADRGRVAQECRTHEWFVPAPRKRDGRADLHSRALTRFPTSRVVPMHARRLPLRPQDRPPSGNRRKHCRNVGASASATSRIRHGNFRSGGSPANVCNAPPPSPGNLPAATAPQSRFQVSA